jgi:probable phosphoglycerate mutase
VSRRLIVAADGGSRGNPGPAGFGAVVLDAGTGEVLAELSESIGRATNNVAEYRGLIAGLRAAAQLVPGAGAEVRMDSRLVVEQMSGRWKIKHPDLVPLAEQARAAAGLLGPVTYTWVPRARNSRADRLANEAMDAAARQASPPPGTERADGAGREAATIDATRRERAGDAWGGSRSGENPVAAVTTVLLRHGQTPLSPERRFAGTGDIPLTPLGVEQARAAAARLAARGGVDLIVTSPLRRARLTAAEVAAATGAPVQAEDGLRETDFGKWEGLSFAEAAGQWPAEMTAWLADPAVAPPGGESLASTAQRVGAALDALVAAHPGRTIVIVSHVNPIKLLVVRALLATPAALHRMQLDVASLSEIDWWGDGTAVLRSFNDTAHLHGG